MKKRNLVVVVLLYWETKSKNTKNYLTFFWKFFFIISVYRLASFNMASCCCCCYQSVIQSCFARLRRYILSTKSMSLVCYFVPMKLPTKQILGRRPFFCLFSASVFEQYWNIDTMSTELYSCERRRRRRCSRVLLTRVTRVDDDSRYAFLE